MTIRKVTRAGRIAYQAYSRVSGAKRYVGTFDSDRAAKVALQEHEVTARAVAAGELPPEFDRTRTLAAAVEEWLASLARRGARSWDGYRDRMKLYVLPHLGTAALARITPSHVMRWRDDAAVKLAPATVNGNLTCLSSAFTYFRKRQWIDKNPCHGVERVENPTTSYNWIRTREEITRLLAHCPGDLRDIVAVAVGAGLRLDEILHLQWADLDLGRRLITVHRGRKGTVKSGKVRHVPILDALLPMLRERALQRGGSVLVFPGRVSTLPGSIAPVRSKPGVQGAYKLAVRRAGLEPSMRFHDLRHTFASHWVMDRGDIFRLSKILGHSSVKITEERYAHLAPEAFEQDYGRVTFTIPTGAVYRFDRGADGRLADRTLVVAGVSPMSPTGDATARLHTLQRSS